MSGCGSACLDVNNDAVAWSMVVGESKAISKVLVGASSDWQPKASLSQELCIYYHVSVAKKLISSGGKKLARGETSSALVKWSFLQFLM